MIHIVHRLLALVLSLSFLPQSTWAEARLVLLTPEPIIAGGIIEFGYEGLEPNEDYDVILSKAGAPPDRAPGMQYGTRASFQRAEPTRFLGVPPGDYLLRLTADLDAKGSRPAQVYTYDIELTVVPYSQTPGPQIEALTALPILEGLPFELRVTGLDPEKRYHMVTLNPAIHSGVNRSYFQAVELRSGVGPSSRISTRMARLPAGDHALRLVDAQTRETVLEHPISVVRARAGSPCSAPIAIENAGECLITAIARASAVGNGVDQKRVRNLFESFTDRPLWAMTCQRAQGIIGAFMESLFFIARDAYPEDEMMTCPTAHAVVHDMAGIDRAFPECRVWAEPGDMKLCFDAMTARYEDDTLIAASDRFLTLFSKGRGVTFAEDLVNVLQQRAAKGVRNVMDRAIHLDIRSCRRGRAFEKLGFTTQVGSYGTEGDHFFTLDPFREVCPVIIELAYEHGYIDEVEFDDWIASYEAREDRIATANRLRASRNKLDFARNERRMKRLRAVIAERDAYLASFEGKLGKAASDAYNRTNLRDLCATGRLGAIAAQARTLNWGALYGVQYEGDACKLEVITTSSAIFYAANGLVTNCADGWCDIRIFIACDMRGLMMAESCETLKSIRPVGRVAYDADGQFVQLALE